MRGTLTAYKDSMGVFVQWREDGNTMAVPTPSDATALFAVVGEFNSPDLKVTAKAKADEHPDLAHVLKFKIDRALPN